MSLADAIEKLIFDFLGSAHDGWEDNDGAYGEFTFDVVDRTIRLDYNERYGVHQLFPRILKEKCSRVGMKRHTPFPALVSPPLSPNRTCQFPGIRLSMRG